MVDTNAGHYSRRQCNSFTSNIKIVELEENSSISIILRDDPYSELRR